MANQTQVKPSKVNGLLWLLGWAIELGAGVEAGQSHAFQYLDCRLCRSYFLRESGCDHSFELGRMEFVAGNTGNHAFCYRRGHVDPPKVTKWKIFYKHGGTSS